LFDQNNSNLRMTLQFFSLSSVSFVDDAPSALHIPQVTSIATTRLATSMALRLVAELFLATRIPQV